MIPRARSSALHAIVLSLAFLIIALSVPPPAAAFCQLGWNFVSSQDNSFSYGPDGQGKKASWSGSVAVWKFYPNHDCIPSKFSIRFGVNDFKIAGLDTFVSWTIQWPDSFTDYNDVAMNRYGNGGIFTPSPGEYVGYTIEVIDGVRPDGVTPSDESVIISTDSPEKTISTVTLWPELQGNFAGRTVHAQVHVGFNLANKVTTHTLPSF